MQVLKASYLNYMENQEDVGHLILFTVLVHAVPTNRQQNCWNYSCNCGPNYDCWWRESLDYTIRYINYFSVWVGLL